jgi:4-phytase/acid phosphatase
MLRARCLCIILSVLALQAAPTEKLEYVVVMSRHGVRSPLRTEAELNSYSAQPWPKWDVPIGYLTAHGRTLMEYMGDYYREDLTKDGLLDPAGCAKADKFYFWSDVDERDVETGHALASRMFRGCNVLIHEGPAGKTDPLFAPVKAGIAKTDPEVAKKARSERAGGSTESLVARYRPQLDAMQTILLGCEPAKTCSPEQTAGKKLLMDDQTNVTGPFLPASMLADVFLLEYTEGKKVQDVGWGHVNQSNLRDMLLLEGVYMDITLRTPYLARANGSNLMSHILKSMQQAAGGAALEGSLGKPGDKGLIFLGHDSNESYLGGMLNLPWQPEGFEPNSRPPGSSLVFEMWKNEADGKYSVRSFFVTQTLEQMRNTVPLSLKQPPLRLPLSIPGCGGESCDWDKFQSVVGSAIDPAFVSNQPLAEKPQATN